MYKKSWYLCAALLLMEHAFGMFDNRFLVPSLMLKPFLIHTEGKHHHLIIQPFAMTARSAFGRRAGIDEEHELFELYGKYNQAEIDQALQKSGRTSASLFRSDWQGYLGGIPWIMAGHFDSFGLAAHYFYQYNSYFGVGCRAYALHANSRMEMLKDPFQKNLFFSEPGDARELFLIKEQMNQALDLCPGIWRKNAFGDLDIYLWAGFERYYFLMCRRFNMGVDLGMLAPIAPARDINNPASVALGGNKHWGMYVTLEGDFDVHEDIQGGFELQMIKRFKRTYCDRLPAYQEPQNFGAIVGRVEVDPGFTLGFNPYVAFKGVRDGLGFLIAYNVTAHWCDSIRVCSNIDPNISAAQGVSQWRSEHATLGVFYDCGYEWEDRGHAPVVNFTWDIPVEWLISQRSFRTHGISFLVEMEF